MQRLPWKLLEAVAPHHAVWNPEGGLVHVSASLRKLWRTEEPFSVLQGKLKLLRPFAGVIQPEWLAELTDVNLRVTHTEKPETVLRGQMFGHEGSWILVGSPDVHSVADLGEMGLKLSDLPIHDGTGDLLIAVETSLVANRETQVRSEQLAKANEELRTVNLALSGFVPRSVLKGLGMDGDFRDDVGLRTEAVGRFIEHLQAAIEFRESFMANMSHELRTPLNAILGVSEVLKEGVYGTLTEKQQEMLQIVLNSGDHLLSLINDVLDLSKIESGEATLRVRNCNLDLLCSAALQLIEQQVKDKGLELKYENESSTESIQVDGRRIRQVLLNLLSNAVKFTDEGQVSVRVDDLSGGDRIRIRVQDTGIGIATEDQASLFQPFFQADHGPNRTYQGTGLGLAITLRSIELHGGRIELESALGEGSCFSVVLPVHSKKTNVGVEMTKRASRGSNVSAEAYLPDSAFGSGNWKTAPRILVVDDVSDNRTHVVDYFLHHGFEVDVAGDGISALRLIFEEMPNIALLDIQMPGLDGLNVIRCLRAMPATRDLPVVALTGSVGEESRDQCMQAGASAFVAKPCDLSELMKLTGSLLGGQDDDPGPE